MSDSTTLPNASGGNELIHFEILKAASLIIGIVPGFIGVALGLRSATVGICQAAEIRTELSLAIIPMAFTSASLINCMLSFFMMFKKNITSYKEGFTLLTAGAFSGSGGFLCSFAIGGIARFTCVTRAQQKKFSSQFFLTMIFAELLGIFSIILSVLLILQ